MSSRPRRNIPSKPTQSSHDVELVRRVQTKSVDAWHEFIDLYSGLIFGVVRRHLFAEDEDDLRTVYVDILKDLHNGGLGKYRGRASLATWLVVVSRASATDFLRKRHGRYRDPEGLKKLSAMERDVLRLFYVERMSIEIVVHTLRWRGAPASVDEVVDCIQRIESVLDRKYLRRLDYEHQCRRSGVDSVRMLKHLIHLSAEYERIQGVGTPDELLIEKDIGEVADQIYDLISKLPRIERQVLDLRFNEGLSARRVSDRLGLGGQRRVYTMIDRIVRNLKVLFTTGPSD